LRFSKTHYEIACKADGCDWHLYTKPVNGANIVSIQKYTAIHKCFGLNPAGNKQATSTFIANKISEKLQQQCRYCPIDIQKDIQRELGVKVLYFKAFRAKETALAQIDGSHQDAYKSLPQYCKDIMKANPNSVTCLKSTDDNKFWHIFISYGASTLGFRHCHPLLDLNGTHLKI
jgi:zinc finger SWIM domain-containing protein 3